MVVLICSKFDMLLIVLPQNFTHFFIHYSNSLHGLSIILNRYKFQILIRCQIIRSKAYNCNITEIKF